MDKRVPETSTTSCDCGSQQNDEIKLKDYYCRSCNSVVGQTDGSRFYVRPLIFVLKVTFMCMNCGHIGQWRPIMPKFNLPER